MVRMTPRPRPVAIDFAASAPSPSPTMTPARRREAIGRVLTGARTQGATPPAGPETLLLDVDLLIIIYNNPSDADPAGSMGKIAGPAIEALNALIAGQACAPGASREYGHALPGP